MSMSAASPTLPDNGKPGAGIDGIVHFVKQPLARGELSDVRFTVGRHFGQIRQFSAHKFVLGFRSPVFRTMFYGRLPEKGQDTIDIPDIHPDAFGIVLSFICTDDVDNLDADNVFATLRCADKYDLLNPDNCLSTLKEVPSPYDALGWHAESTVEICLALVDAKTAAVLRTEAFVNISRSLLRTILQRDTLTAEENAIYLAVERWAAAACTRTGTDASGGNRRLMLGGALFLVRFPLLGNSQLAEGPGKSGLLTDAEMLNLFMYRNSLLC
ncbi:BTB/POZ domain-containing protein 6-like [Paramacrobiotus metropolitanus]|uniref:BTB/POZ domain-containing protein 6-like n=1 Tax=Paramacrobiotus metropolitanus TaxID=2943436 RepID=UPI0024464BAE|nr:BTB/POZ domain-containing protein 6-like [Paramacrobiotus metropolitanus]